MNFRQLFDKTLDELLHITGKYGMNSQKFAEGFIWYTIGEIICYISDNTKYSDSGVDLCGCMLMETIGNNNGCHDIIYAVRDKDTNYEMIMREMIICSELSKLGTLWHQVLRSDSYTAIISIIDFINFFSNQFLPSLQDNLERLCLQIYKEYYNQKALAKSIRDKRKVFNSFAQKLHGYMEIKQILA